MNILELPLASIEVGTDRARDLDPAWVLVLTNIRVAGVNNTYSATGYIRRNGVDVESSSYSVGVYSWMLTMFKTVDIAAGNHTFNHAYTGTAADYSQPRIAIFGTYK